MTDIQIDMWVDWQIDILTDSQIYRMIETWTARWTDRQANIQTRGREREREACQCKEEQTDRYTGGQTYLGSD